MVVIHAAWGQAPLGQFTPGAYGSGSRLCGRIAEPLGLIARDCDFTVLFVSDFWSVRLAAKLGPETASNNPAEIATTWNLAIVIFVANADRSAGVFHQNGEKRCALFATPVESFVRYRLYRLVWCRAKWCPLKRVTDKKAVDKEIKLSVMKAERVQKISQERRRLWDALNKYISGQGAFIVI
jgi:hypothetical protein